MFHKQTLGGVVMATKQNTVRYEENGQCQGGCSPPGLLGEGQKKRRCEAFADEW